MRTAILSFLSAAIGLAAVPPHFERDTAAQWIAKAEGYSVQLNASGAEFHIPGRTPVKMDFGAKASGSSGLEPTGGVSNYIKGARTQWRLGVPHFGKLRFERLYPGIDVVYRANGQSIEFDFLLAPGADPNRIGLSWAGADALSLSGAGDLLVRTGEHKIALKRPVAYQSTGSGQKDVTASFVLRGGRVQLALGKYDRKLPLIIDPEIVYSTFLGGGQQVSISGNVFGRTSGDAIAVDASGNAYVAGSTHTPDFPTTTGAYDTAHTGNGEFDAYIAKLNPAGTALLYSTFIGGSGLDRIEGIAVDSAGALFVVGDTTSPEFPTTPGAAPRGVGLDVFVMKLTAAGVPSAINFLSGNNVEVAVGLALAGGDAFVSGITASENFPVTVGTRGGESDCFAARLNGSTLAVMYSRLLGGRASEDGCALAVNTLGEAFVIGSTFSLDYPVTSGAYSTELLGGHDTFVTKLSSTGSAIVASTFFGGGDLDYGQTIAVDAGGNVVLAGRTFSRDLPTHARAFQPLRPGGITGSFGSAPPDAFLAKLDLNLSSLVFASYLGGTEWDDADSLAINSAGDIFLGGATKSVNFPVTQGAYDTVHSGQATFDVGPESDGWDGYLVKVSADGSRLLYSTVVGGALQDYVRSIAVSGVNAVYATGITDSSDFPTTPGAFDTTFNGVSPSRSTRHLGNAFVTKFDNLPTPAERCVYAVTPSSFPVPRSGGLFTLAVSAPSSCAWTTQLFVSGGSQAARISGSPSGSGPGTVTVVIDQNAGSGRLLVAGQDVQFTMEAASDCVVSLGTSLFTAPAQGASNVPISVTYTNSCAWGGQSYSNFLQLFPVTGVTPSTTLMNVFPNFKTTARTGRAGIGGQTLTVEQEAGSGTADERLVRYLYFAFFGRTPSAEEVAAYVALLRDGVSRRDIAFSFFASEEFAAGGAFVAGLYAGILDRDAEFGGWLFQRTALASGAVTAEGLVANFLGAPEAALRFGSATPERFVELLYTQVLRRRASDEEVAFHTATLAAGVTRPQLATAFLNSEEFRIGLGPRLLSFLLYAALLGRDATAGERSARAAELYSGVPFENLIDQFVSSPEFNAQFQ